VSCGDTLQTSIFQITSALIYITLFVDIIYEHFDAPISLKIQLRSFKVIKMLNVYTKDYNIILKNDLTKL
jgi:hypothetical protein